MTIDECTVECVDEGQCKDGVVIFANSGKVTILCSAITSCDKVVVLNNNAASDITIELTAEKAAENMVIDIGLESSNLTLIASGKEAFASGLLTCDANCDVSCTGEDSCKDAVYECLTPSTQCLLDCDTDINKCPVISNFGDADCTSGDCVIDGNGNSRIVALEGTSTLTVICDDTVGQCKTSGSGLTIFSAADVTILKCNEITACEGVSLTVGSLDGDLVPKGFKSEQFMGSSYDVIIDANTDSAAKSLSLYTKGPVTSVINGNGTDSLEEIVSICDGCTSLTVNCREFDGCLGASILCTDALNCECINAYEVDIGNDTAELATTLTPRNSCPDITPFLVRKSGTESNNNSIFSKKGFAFSMGALLPLSIIVALVIFGAVVCIKKHKSYQSINGKDSKYMLKNENIYSTYQVEMHQ